MGYTKSRALTYQLYLPFVHVALFVALATGQLAYAQTTHTYGGQGNTPWSSFERNNYGYYELSGCNIPGYHLQTNATKNGRAAYSCKATDDCERFCATQCDLEGESCVAYVVKPNAAKACRLKTSLEFSCSKRFAKKSIAAYIKSPEQNRCQQGYSGVDCGECADGYSGDASQQSGRLLCFPDNETIDATVHQFMADLKVPGMQIAIVKQGDVQWAKSYGYANLETQSKVQFGHSFLLASISKTVTSVALMQLFESGAFALDDAIGEHLPFSVENPSFNQPITFRHLLTHASSIRDNWSNMPVSEGDSSIPLGVFLESYFTLGAARYDAEYNFFQAEPGERYEYSNIGIALAGYLVETISGKDFSRWCQENIFGPLGMQHTGWHLSDLAQGSIATPHTYDSDTDTHLVLKHYGYPDYPDGQLRSNVLDMGKFLAMFAQRGIYKGIRVLDESTIAQMQRYHLVWKEIWINHELFLGHGGRDKGASTEMYFRVKDGTGYLILMNTRRNDVRAYFVDELFKVEKALVAAVDTMLEE